MSISALMPSVGVLCLLFLPLVTVAAQSAADTASLARALAAAITAPAERHKLRGVDTFNIPSQYRRLEPPQSFSVLVAAALRDHKTDSTGLRFRVERLLFSGDSVAVFTDWSPGCQPNGDVWGDRMSYTFVRAAPAWTLVKAELRSHWDGACTRTLPR
jgi:hypothetical protein